LKKIMKFTIAMENPATWGPAERVVDGVIRDHYLARREEMKRGEFRAGLSLARQITDALREAGLLPRET
jgi:hypothetical protein